MVVTAVLLMLVIVKTPNTQDNHSKDTKVMSQVAHMCNANKSQAALKSIGNTICLHGQITDEMARCFGLIDEKEGTYVVVSSSGGDVLAAIDIGERIADRHLQIIIDGICLSSCANYLFTAGSTKSVMPDSLLGFHGGPGQAMAFIYRGPGQLRETAIHNNISYTELVIRKEEEFFQKIGIDRGLIYDRPEPLSKSYNPLLVFWVYDREKLQQYGIRNLILYHDPGDRSLLDQVFTFVNGFSCHKINRNAWLCS